MRLGSISPPLAIASRDRGPLFPPLPRFNNDFHVRTRSPEAQKYNNQSPNENMHACRAVELTMEHEFNFTEGLDDEELATVRS